MGTEIVIKKGQGRLYVYQNKKAIFETQIAHGRTGTTTGKRKIKKWAPGPVALRADYSPITWFSFDATFDPSYRWPAPGKTGFVHLAHGQFEAKRTGIDTGWVKFNNEWYAIHKDSNPFGALMADLDPGKIELHGTGRDINGQDVLPSMSGNDITHGCVRVSNSAIRRIKSLAPVGTEVRIES
jgi:hypothetical protein